MTSPTTPPSSAERLLRLSIRDLKWRDAVTGDLREEFADIARRRGATGARRWYWRQSLALTARFAAGRVIPAVTPKRRTGVAELEAMSLGSGWVREFRHAWRALWQRPGLSAVIVGTLALALAANAVIFNLADALYLRPFRFASLVAESRRSKVEAMQIAEDSKADWWEKNQNRLAPPEA